MSLFKTEHLPGGAVERWYSEPDGTIHRKLSQNVDGTFEAIAALSEYAKTPDRYYLGSIPMNIAGRWARECGAGIGTQEFAEYAKKKLMGGEYAKLSTGIKA